MVVARSRILALWFTALLLVSIVPAVAPVASATHSLQATTQELRINGVLYDTATKPLVKPGDVLSYRLVLSWSTETCTNNGTPATGPPFVVEPGQSEWVFDPPTIDLTNFGGSATAAPSTNTGPTPTSREVIFTHTVASTTLAASEGANVAATATIKMTCPASGTGTTPREEESEFSTPGMNLDAKKPTISILTQPVASHANAAERQSVGTATTAAIGSDITYAVSVDDAVSSITARTQELNGSAEFWGIPTAVTSSLSTATQTIQVQEAGQAGFQTLNGAPVKFTIRAVDDAGNVATDFDTNTIQVDNVRPPETTDFRASQGYLNLAPGTDASSVRVNWSSTAVPADVEHARVKVVTNEHPSGMYGFATAPVDAASLVFTLANPYTASVNVTLTPIDAAGNIRNTTAANQSPPFIPGFKAEYGGLPSQPFAVTGGGVRNVYVNISSALAPTPLNPTSSSAPETTLPRIFATFARNASSTDIDYWEVGCAGSSAANHFQENPTIDTSVAPTCGDAAVGKNTAFRPHLIATTANPLVSAQGAYIFTNLSDLGSGDLDRAFIGGNYQLIVNATTPAGVRTTVTQHLAVDGTPPALIPHGTGANQNPTYPSGVGANWTEIHGADGNPLRVYYKVQDGRLDQTANSGNTLLDSKLRNVTFELIDPVTFEVVKRTNVTDDLSTPVDERLARENFDLQALAGQVNPDFPYFYDFRGPAFTGFPPGSSCTSTTDFSDACIWRRVAVENNWSMSWFNETNFSGWVNLTYPDLPAGKFKVRVLAWDRANGLVSHTYGAGATENDLYKVAPIAKVHATANSPFLTTDNKLDVIALASQRYDVIPDDVRAQCVGWMGDQTTGGMIENICPASLVRIYVSNTNGASDAGVLFAERGLADNVVIDELNTKGWTGSYVGVPTRAAGNGTLEFDDTLTRRYFQYTTNQPGTLPGGINPALDVYVKVVAVYKKGNTEIVSSTSEWVKAISLSTPTIKINQPPCDPMKPVCDEWTINITDPAAPGGQARPPFNITFDRRTDPNVPMLNWSIVNVSSGQVVAWNNNEPVDLVGTAGATPRYVFNWTGILQNQDGSVLKQGGYQLRTRVYVPIPGSADLQLAALWRNFTVLDAKPTIELLPAPQQLSPGIQLGANGRWTTLQNFELSFLVNHSEANLTSVDQLKYHLTRNNPPAGEPATIEAGQFGFVVVTRADTPLDASLTQSRFTANITLPPLATDGNTFRLNITALLDVFPFRMGNSSAFPDLLLDRQEPSAGLLVQESEDTVYNFGIPASSAPQNDAFPPGPMPAFKGFAEDHGSGVASVQVRVVDLTLGKTLNWLSGGGIGFSNGETDTWATGTIATSRVQLQPAVSGKRLWTLNVSSSWADDESLPINISHKYRVDVIARDALGRTSSMTSTPFDFDARAPFLGYSGQLGTFSNVQSGLLQPSGGKNKVNWHGTPSDSLVLTVNVTDNRCLAAVRLVGFSEHETTTIVKANMTPATANAVCPNGATVQYRVDLATAVNAATGVPLADLVGNYTFWWEAEDQAGQVTEIPANFRTLKIEVIDKDPAKLVGSPSFDPPTGQAGGRTIVRANVFDNLAVEKVTVTFKTLSGTVVKKGEMRPANASSENGVGLWIADTTDDLGIELNVGDYLVEIAPYDVNWNRSAAEGGPTCSASLGFCPPYGQSPIYPVRDDGPPAVVLESPNSPTATLNATPIIKVRALHKALEIGHISVKATTDGNASNLTSIPTAQLNFSELKSSNGTRQGWTVTYSPTAALPDNTTLILNVSASLASLGDAKQFTFRVDAAGPEVNHTVSGLSTLGNASWATSATRVTLLANDTVSTATILYKVNGGAETTYAGPITPSGNDGTWSLEYWATDPTGNVAAKKTLTLNLDATGPRITVAKHGDEILLTVTDGSGSGVNESSVTVHYRYGDATSYTTRKADKIAGNSFGTTLPGNANDTGLAYYFTAEDLLGNDGTNFSAAAPYTIRKENGTPVNLPPTIHINAPTAGTPVRGSVELRWLAEDPEEAPLTITISIRQPDPGRVLVPAGENSGSYTINTTGFPAGAYTVVVLANDGENSASAQVTFNVESSEVIQARNVPPATVVPNTQVGVAVAINPIGKTVATASYRLVLNGQPFATGTLAPSQGLYAAAFTPSQPGNYSILVDVIYSDGSSEPSKQVATFSVPGEVNPPGEGGAGTFPTSLMTLVAIALLTVALAAYGAFGRWKK